MHLAAHPDLLWPLPFSLQPLVFLVVAASLFETLSRFFASYGYAAVFFGVMLENSGLPVPGETVLLFAAFLAAHGRLSLGWAILTAIAGATTGDSLGYGIGKIGGEALLKKYRGRFLSRERFDRAQATFQRWGHWAVFAARFITGLRVLAGPLAGALHMPYGRFFVANLSGAVVWASTVGVVGFMFGTNWRRLVNLFGQVDLVVLLLVAAGCLTIYARRKRQSGRS